MEFYCVVNPDGSEDFVFESLHEHPLGCEGGHALESYRFIVGGGLVSAKSSFSSPGELSDFLDEEWIEDNCYTLQSLESCLDLVETERKRRLEELESLSRLESFLRSLPLKTRPHDWGD